MYSFKISYHYIALRSCVRQFSRFRFGPFFSPLGLATCTGAELRATARERTCHDAQNCHDHNTHVNDDHRGDGIIEGILKGTEVNISETILTQDIATLYG